MENKDVELLAIWLYEAAREHGQLDIMRRLIRRAAVEAADTYASPDDSLEASEKNDPFGVSSVIARFAAHWDDLESESKGEDDTLETPKQ